ncbi:MAG: cysteine desulfurase family protein [Pseudomonadota bacterium]
MRHYLDYNATAPARPEVIAEINKIYEMPLNASSVHNEGRIAKSIIDKSRNKIAEIIGVFASEIIFTASGTEANNWVIKSFSKNPIIVSAIEHLSILKAIDNPLIIPVTSEGIIDLLALEKIIATQPTNFMASVMLANNETGVIQPIKEIAEIVHKFGGILHVDAVQAYGKIAINFNDLNCDIMTISAHKMGGIIGAAALIIKNNIPIKPMLLGGGQEKNRRAGTENIVAISAFSKASELIDLSQMNNLRIWLNKMEEEITLLGGKIIGKNSPRIPNTSCIFMPNVSSETQIISFDLEGISISAGSACSSGRIEASHVLKAMNLPDTEINNTIRLSAGWNTSEDEINKFSKIWKKIFERKN